MSLWLNLAKVLIGAHGRDAQRDVQAETFGRWLELVVPSLRSTRRFKVDPRDVLFARVAVDLHYLAWGDPDPGRIFAGSHKWSDANSALTALAETDRLTVRMAEDASPPDEAKEGGSQSNGIHAAGTRDEVEEAEVYDLENDDLDDVIEEMPLPAFSPTFPTTMDQPCGPCLGSGRTTCPGCNGRRQVPETGVVFDTRMMPCSVCSMTGQVGCTFCGGRGRIQIQTFQAPTAVSRSEATKPRDPLEGNWYAVDGSRLEVRRKNATYLVTARNAIAADQGTAILDGETVTIQISSSFIGNYQIRGRVRENELHATMAMGGVPVTIVLHRR